MAHVKNSTVAFGVMNKEDYSAGNIGPIKVLGTGFYVSSDGYAMTAAHVLEECIRTKENSLDRLIVGLIYTITSGSSLNLK